MKFTFKRTDKRHNGHKDWQYIVVVQSLPSARWGTDSKIQKTKFLNELREWCWTTYGPSCELELWLTLPEGAVGKNDKWCWHTNFDNFKIYLRTEKEANWFKIKWL